MTEIMIPVYSEQLLVPRASEIIRAILDAKFPEHDIKFCEWRAGMGKVLVFGKAPENVAYNTQYIYTYSIAQILSKANAASVLAAGIRQFINEPEPIPFNSPIRFRYVGTFENYGWDFDAPTAIDIETSGDLGGDDTPETVGIISIAFYQEGHSPWVIAPEAGNLVNPRIGDLIAKFTKPIYHNGKFDTRVMNRVFGREFPVWFDTMLAHHVLNHAAGDHKLKTAARRYLGAPEWEADLSKYTVGGSHYENIPKDKLVEYNGWDVYWTYKLWEFLSPQLEADVNNMTAYELEMAAARFLLEVEKNGIPFDVDYSIEYESQLLVEQLEVKLKLDNLVAYEINPNSPQQVKKFYENAGVQLPNTREQTLIDEKDNMPLFAQQATELILEYRKLGKIMGTYCRGWRDRSREHRVHPTFLVHGTSTGRLSSTSPNAQNLPRDKKIRKIVSL